MSDLLQAMMRDLTAAQAYTRLCAQRVANAMDANRPTGPLVDAHDRARRKALKIEDIVSEQQFRERQGKCT